MKPITLPKGIGGFTLYTLCLIAAVLALPPIVLEPGAKEFIFVVGIIAIWRYTWGGIHFFRSIIFNKIVFPKLRRQVDENEEALMPSHVYLLVTSFRIESQTTIDVFKSVVREAVECGIPTTIVASIVELGEEFLMKEIFAHYNPPEHVKLSFVRIPGTGKRDGLSYGYRAISRDMPATDAVVAVIDGDSILQEGLIRKTVPFFKLNPNMGALTTDEECEVRGSKIIREWHSMRFAQRQILMCSMALSKRVLTLTGRMSMFRADIITNPDFIKTVEGDSIDHWRLGHFKFLTGDDKSSWYWVIKNRYSMMYVPDVLVNTVEHPPAENFFKATSMLMFRWFGNMLRTNSRALNIPPHITGFFTWWTLMDQRISMWTSLSGPVFVTLLCLKHSIVFLPIYLTWIGFTRWIMTLMLLTSRPVLHWTWPFLIYYNQIYGSAIKTFVFFRLDRQSWTRQKTKLQRGLSPWKARLVKASSIGMHSLAIVTFVTLVGVLTGMFEFPTTALKVVGNLL